MQNFFDFIDLITNECASLLEICPPSVVTLFSSCVTFALLLSLKRAIID